MWHKKWKKYPKAEQIGYTETMKEERNRVKRNILRPRDHEGKSTNRKRYRVFYYKKQPNVMKYLRGDSRYYDSALERKTWFQKKFKIRAYIKRK